MTTGKESSGKALPLDGITVVDFTSNGAGPSCTMLLGDFGAEVIKVESPGGDSTRHWGSTRLGENRDFTPSFLSLNRNKSSIALDLKSEQGRQSVQALIARADVIIESFTPGVAARLGIGYEQVSVTRPDIVFCSLSGFGQNGPLADRPGFDMLMQAFVGHMSITGEPGRPSVRNGPSSIDLLTGAHAALAIVLAVRHRDRTGIGQAIDISLFDTSVYLVGMYISDYKATGELPGKMGSHLPLMTPYGVFRARDREFYIGMSSDAMWRSFCNEVGRPELAADPRFVHNGERTRNSKALHAELDVIFAREDAQHWLDLALRLGLPASLVRDIAEVAADAHTAARGLIIDSGIEGVPIVGTPFRMSATPGSMRKRPPGLDEDRQRLLGRAANDP